MKPNLSCEKIDDAKFYSQYNRMLCNKHKKIKQELIYFMPLQTIKTHIFITARMRISPAQKPKKI